MIQKHVTKTTVVFFGDLEPINEISIHFIGDNLFDIQVIWVTSSVTEQIKVGNSHSLNSLGGLFHLLFS